LYGWYNLEGILVIHFWLHKIGRVVLELNLVYIFSPFFFQLMCEFLAFLGKRGASEALRVNVGAPNAVLILSNYIEMTH
jgi:hypothetical protein